jgi:RNA polymerase sigma-70 factor (ECF subfamily)
LVDRTTNDVSTRGENVTQLLVDYRAGDAGAMDRLVPLVYAELRRIAAGYLRRERDGHTLQPTALVHEAYMRMVDQRDAPWQNRAHFLGCAAHLMRHILVDHARRRRAAKRGGGGPQVTLGVAEDVANGADVDLVALDDALKTLETIDARQRRMVELRFFGGLSIEETAEVLGMSSGQVRREWTAVRAWLRRELERV